MPALSLHMVKKSNLTTIVTFKIYILINDCQIFMQMLMNVYIDEPHQKKIIGAYVETLKL